jgi:hypothetical protein
VVGARRVVTEVRKEVRKRVDMTDIFISMTFSLLHLLRGRRRLSRISLTLPATRRRLRNGLAVLLMRGGPRRSHYKIIEYIRRRERQWRSMQSWQYVKLDETRQSLQN